MKRRYFGTDGVRGPYGGPVINEDFAARLGLAAARWATAAGQAGEVLIGCDTRASGVSLVQALADGLAQGSLRPVSLGVVPTPAVARAVCRQRAVLGVVVTASHNPAADNGIKFFGSGGVKLTDAEEAAIESLLPDVRPPASGRPAPARDAERDYIAAMSAVLAGRLAGWRIVLDTAHGATVRTSGAVLRELGADLIAIGAAPTGRNINEGVGSEHPEAMCAAVQAHGARLGIAHDGDGDRCILCDERGELLDGVEILTILAVHALRANRLPGRTLFVTVQSNLGVDAAVTAAGGRVLRTDVGDRYVIERMLAEHAQLGGESSGHIISTDVAPTGDGLVAALKVLEVMLATGEPLSSLRRVLRKFPSLARALRVQEKRPLESLEHLTAAIRQLEHALGASGRVLVRYSGTEPKLRLLVEGPTTEAVESGLAALETAARRDLQVV